MENGNVLSQMAQYDFSTPINVTMIFEDSDEETTNENKLKEEIIIEEDSCRRINDQEKTEIISNDCNANKNISSKEEFRNGIMAKTQLDGLNQNENIQTVNNPSSLTQVNTVNKQNPSIMTNNIEPPTKKAGHDISSIYQQINENEELTSYVKDLLNTLSEHLIIIMKPYYNFYYKHPNVPLPPELLTQLNRLKAHLFDLSYSTVISLILPQENNEIFIQKFIDKTVTAANKELDWICGRHHIEPFFNEMVEWARQKRTHIKTLGLRKARMTKTKNDNRILKEKLANPPRPPNTSHLTGVPPNVQNTNNRRGSDIENATCIFSGGSPGREVSISINPSLIKPAQHPGNQQAPVNTMQQTGKIYYPPADPMLRQVYNDNRVHHPQQNPYAQNHTVHHIPLQSRPPPPAYGVQNLNIPPSVPQNILSQMQETFQSMQNYHRNVNSFTAAASNNSNLGVTHNTQNESQPTPVITSVTSLNPNLIFGRCCICGKSTNMRCSKCNNFSYCSHLCQELDSGAHKTVCSKSNY